MKLCYWKTNLLFKRKCCFFQNMWRKKKVYTSKIILMMLQETQKVRNFVYTNGNYISFVLVVLLIRRISFSFSVTCFFSIFCRYEKNNMKKISPFITNHIHKCLNNQFKIQRILSHKINELICNCLFQLKILRLVSFIHKIYVGKV